MVTAQSTQRALSPTVGGVGTELSHLLHASRQLFTIFDPFEHHVSVRHCGHRPRVLVSCLARQFRRT
jgi:hypothetical protein